MKRTRLFAFIFGLSTITACCISNAFALHIKGVNNVSFEIRGPAAHSITFMTTYSSSTWSGTTLTAQDGAAVTGTIPTPSKNGYTFLGWTDAVVSSTNYASEFTTQQLASKNDYTADTTYWPILRKDTYTLNYQDEYNTSKEKYPDATNIECTIDSRYVKNMSLNRQYEGGVTVKIAGYDTQRDLISTSGVYRLVLGNTPGGDGAVAIDNLNRKIGFKIDTSKNNWWTNASAKFYIYYFNSDSDNGWSSQVSVNGTVFIPYNYQKVIATRCNSDTTTPAWNKVWNQTKDCLLTGGNKYSSSKLYLCVYDADSGDSNKHWVDWVS